MKDSQTVLIPPAGVEKSAGSKTAKDGGPKVFNFDRSYWSFSKGDPSYGASALVIRWVSTGISDGFCSGPGESV